MRFVCFWGVLLCLSCAARGQGGVPSSTPRGAPDAPEAEAYDTRARSGLMSGDAVDPSLQQALRASCQAAGLVGDARLAELARTVARDSRGGKLAPNAAQVTFQARRLGLVEPTPQLWLASAASASAIAPALRDAVAEAARGESLTHCGGASVRGGDGVIVAVALSRRLLALDHPILRAPAVEDSVSFSGRLAKGYSAEALAMTSPDGNVERIALPKGRNFSRSLRFKTRGEHTLELLAEGPQGTTVVAILALSIGVAPALKPPAASSGEVEHDASEVARKLAALIAAERKQRGLSALAYSPALEAVALAHSQDMRDHHFVAHVSKQTGGAQDRVARAGLHTVLLLENIGRGYSAAEIHAGLMESPGHRANILNPDARSVGVGVTSEGEGGRLAFLATELFARMAEPVDAKKAPAQLFEAISAQRRAKKLASVTLSAALSRAAQKAADAYAQGVHASDQATLDAAMQGIRRLPQNATALTAALIKAEDLTQVAVAPELLAPQLRALGIGVARLPAGSSHALAIVLLLAVGG